MPEESGKRTSAIEIEERPYSPTFTELLRDSVIIQGVVTLALLFAVIYLACAGKDIPELLSTATSLVLGFYFGSKVQNAINVTRQYRR